MIDRKGSNLKFVIRENAPRFDVEQVDRYRRRLPTQHNAVDQVINPFHRVATTVYIDFFDRFPAHKRRKQTRET